VKSRHTAALRLCSTLCTATSAGKTAPSRTSHGPLERAQVRRRAIRGLALPHCNSLHARDEVDLAHYYADYPFHKLRDTKVDWMLQAMYRNLLSRIRATGFTQSSSLLDFGCGSGQFPRVPTRQGFRQRRGLRRVLRELCRQARALAQLRRRDGPRRDRTRTDRRGSCARCTS